MSCPEIPELTYADFSRRIFDTAGQKRLPISMELEFTHRCNVRCVHCYLPESHGDSSCAEPELSGDEIRRIFDQAVDLGVLWILITGGEPLVRQDFADLYLYAKRCGFIITLFTNGTMITEEIADLLAEYPPFATEVTVHSMNPGVFDAVTQVPGSFERCMAGIQRLVDRKLSLRIKSVAMRPTRDSVGDVAAFAESIGAHYRFDPHVTARTDGGEDPLGVRLTAKEVVSLDSADPARLDAWVNLLEKLPPADPTKVFSCGAGIRSFHVDSFGHMAACGMARYMTYDLRSEPMRAGWDEFIPSVIDRPAEPGFECGSCDRLLLCMRCAGWAFTEEGDEQAVVPYLCEVGDERLRVLKEHVAKRERKPAVLRG